MTKQHKQPTKFEQMGRAALLPGMQYMLELMQRELDDMKQWLNGTAAEVEGVAADEATEAPVAKPKRKLSAKQLRAMRKSAARARAALRAQREAAGAKPAKPKKGATLPLKVDGLYTKPGAAKEIGIALSTVERLMRDGELQAKYGKSPNRGGPRIKLIDPASVAAVKAERNGVRV